MDGGWVPVGNGLSKELVCAIGEVALAFALVDVAVSMALCLKDSKSAATYLHSKVFARNLTKKLKDLGKAYPCLRERACHIQNLSEARNDIMHGWLCEVIWSTEPFRLGQHHAMNLGKGRNFNLVVDELNRMSNDARIFADKVAKSTSN